MLVIPQMPATVGTGQDKARLLCQWQGSSCLQGVCLQDVGAGQDVHPGSRIRAVHTLSCPPAFFQF